MKTYKPEQDNTEFWNRVNNLPIDTEQSLEEFWQCIHQPEAEYDSGILEYQERLRRFDNHARGDADARI